MDDYEVRPIDIATARGLLEQGHYLGTVWTGGHNYGLYAAATTTGQLSFAPSLLVGAAVFAPPVRENVTASLWDGGTRANTAELTRFYTIDGLDPNTGTWFLRRTVAQLPPQIEMLVAYADPYPHTDANTEYRNHGGLYQAASWLYTGRTKSAYHYLDSDGKTRVGKKRPWRIAVEQGLRDGERPYQGEARVAAERGWTRIEGIPKYRYVKPRTRRARRALKLTPLPYPKPEPNKARLRRVVDSQHDPVHGDR
jgi:hypothetical protein